MKPYKNSIMAKAIERLNLNDYQQRALFSNPEKYDLMKLVKRGVVIYAPLNVESKGFKEKIAGFFKGPRADLIGEKIILVKNQRCIKLFPTGFFRARDTKGGAYYADSAGRRLTRGEFMKII